MIENRFNSYKDGLNLSFLKDYCIHQGHLVRMEPGEIFEMYGQPSHKIGYIINGYFKYIVFNPINQKDYITGFAFKGEFVTDYPNCLYGNTSEVTIEAGVQSEIYLAEGEDIRKMYYEDQDKLHMGRLIAENLFTQTYSRFLDFYRTDARTRYEHLLSRCPEIVQHLPLKDIASFLAVTPKTISKIRHEITFGL